jgi:hypothetical protein
VVLDYDMMYVVMVSFGCIDVEYCTLHGTFAVRGFVELSVFIYMQFGVTFITK